MFHNVTAVDILQDGSSVIETAVARSSGGKPETKYLCQMPCALFIDQQRQSAGLLETEL